MKNNNITYILIFAFIALISCGDDNEKSILDQDLENALLSASAGNGIDYFKIPSSNDLALIPQDPKNETNIR